MTIGERMIRTEFNPSKEGVVDQFKQQTAKLIDKLEELHVYEAGNWSPIRVTPKEKWRLIEQAQTYYEIAATCTDNSPVHENVNT